MLGSPQRRGFVGVCASLAVVSLVATACNTGSNGSSDSKSSGGATTPDSTSTNTSTSTVTSLSKAPGFDGKAFTVGALIPLTGPVAGAGEQTLQGIKAEVDAVNRAGGIDGKYKVQIKTYDTQYDPAKAVQGYNATSAQVSMYAEILGTAPAQAVLPLAKKDGVSFVPGSGALSWWRVPGTVPVGAAYDSEAATATSWYIDKAGTSKKVCTLAQDDDFGAAGINGVSHAIQTLKGSAGKTVKFPAGNPDFTAQVQSLRTSKCDAVFAVTVPSDTAKVLSTAAQLNFTPQWLFFSNSWDGSITNGPLKSYVASRVAVATDLPVPTDTANAGMKSLLASLKADGVSSVAGPNVVTGANYGAVVLATLTKAIQLGDVSRAGIQKAITQLGKTNFDGLSGEADYGPIESRTPPTDIKLLVPDASNSFGLKVSVTRVSPNAAESLPIK